MITENTKVEDLRKHKDLKTLFPYFIYNQVGDGAGNFKKDATCLKEIEQKNPTWAAEDMVYGLRQLEQICASGGQVLFDVYDSKEVQESPDKECVKLIYFPAKQCNNGSRKTIILAAGGAYGSVCSMVESFPVAARLAELGVDAFCLNYRVADGKALFPRPMEDMGAACQFLMQHQDTLGINMEHYAVGGFSAGGHLAACWGTPELGYAAYQVSKPDIILLAYPMVDVWKTVSLAPLPIRAMMLSGYLGKDHSQKVCDVYNVEQHMDITYPPAFVVQAEDDPTVPVWNSQVFIEQLQTLQIPYCYEHPQHGLHGFGLGTNTEAVGWADRAFAFWNKLERD